MQPQNADWILIVCRRQIVARIHFISERLVGMNHVESVFQFYSNGISEKSKRKRNKTTTSSLTAGDSIDRSFGNRMKLLLAEYCNVSLDCVGDATEFVVTNKTTKNEMTAVALNTFSMENCLFMAGIIYVILRRKTIYGNFVSFSFVCIVFLSLFIALLLFR